MCMARLVYNYLFSCGTYEAGRSATWNKRDRFTGFGTVMSTISVEQKYLSDLN